MGVSSVEEGQGESILCFPFLCFLIPSLALSRFNETVALTHEQQSSQKVHPMHYAGKAVGFWKSGFREPLTSEGTGPGGDSWACVTVRA